MPEMESVQGEKSIFYARLCRKADKWPTRHWTGLFYRQLQRPPCTVSQRRTYLQNRLCQLITCSQNWWRQKTSSVVKGLKCTKAVLARCCILHWMQKSTLYLWAQGCIKLLKWCACSRLLHWSQTFCLTCVCYILYVDSEAVTLWLCFCVLVQIINTLRQLWFVYTPNQHS